MTDEQAKTIASAIRSAGSSVMFGLVMIHMALMFHGYMGVGH